MATFAKTSRRRKHVTTPFPKEKSVKGHQDDMESEDVADAGGVSLVEEKKEKKHSRKQEMKLELAKLGVDVNTFDRYNEPTSLRRLPSRKASAAGGEEKPEKRRKERSDKGVKKRRSSKVEEKRNNEEDPDVTGVSSKDESVEKKEEMEADRPINNSMDMFDMSEILENSVLSRGSDHDASTAASDETEIAASASDDSCLSKHPITPPSNSLPVQTIEKQVPSTTPKVEDETRGESEEMEIDESTLVPVMNMTETAMINLLSEPSAEEIRTAFQGPLQLTTEGLFQFIVAKAAAAPSSSIFLLETILRRDSVFLILNKELRDMQQNTFLKETHSVEALFLMILRRVQGVVAEELNEIIANYHGVLAIIS